MEMLAESRIREKYELTVPIPVRELMKLEPGHWLRFIINGNGQICVLKAVTRVVNNQYAPPTTGACEEKKLKTNVVRREHGSADNP